MYTTNPITTIGFIVTPSTPFFPRCRGVTRHRSFTFRDHSLSIHLSAHDTLCVRSFYLFLFLDLRDLDICREVLSSMILIPPRGLCGCGAVAVAVCGLVIYRNHFVLSLPSRSSCHHTYYRHCGEFHPIYLAFDHYDERVYPSDFCLHLSKMPVSE